MLTVVEYKPDMRAMALGAASPNKAVPSAACMHLERIQKPVQQLIREFVGCRYDLDDVSVPYEMASRLGDSMPLLKIDLALSARKAGNFNFYFR